MPSRAFPAPGPRVVLAALLVPALALGVVSTSPSPDPAGRASLREALEPEPLFSPWGMVVSSSDAASRAGARILEEGGNAVDAAVATAFALTASDPSESGLGGESWILIQPADRPPVAVLCPSRAPRRFDLDALRRARAGAGVTGHQAAAVPTSVAALAAALERYGTMSLAEVLAPAIEEAERGWEVGWIEAVVVRPNAWRISLSPFLSPVLLPGACEENGYPAPAASGARLRLPALAGTLRRLAEAGANDFYLGALASEIDADMRASGGFVRRDDLARVPATVYEIEPVRARYRDREVLSIGTPAAGGILAEALQVLGAFPPEVVAGDSADAHQLLVEAVRIAREDSRAATTLGRPQSGGVLPPFLEPGHAVERAREIRLGAAWKPEALGPREQASPHRMENTTQISVVDARRNAVSITQTLGADWGSCSAGERLGFPYNSVLNWFEYDKRGHPEYLRPMGSVAVPSAPTIVLREGAVEMVLGSPGSSRISSAILSVVRNVVDRGMSLPDAVAAPRLLWQDEGPIRRLVAESVPPVSEEVLAELAKRGYADPFVVREPGPDLPSFGCVNAVGWNAVAGAWEGVGDPRRRGVAAAPSDVPRSRPPSLGSSPLPRPRESPARRRESSSPLPRQRESSS